MIHREIENLKRYAKIAVATIEEYLAKLTQVGEDRKVAAHELLDDLLRDDDELFSIEDRDERVWAKLPSSNGKVWHYWEEIIGDNRTVMGSLILKTFCGMTFFAVDRFPHDKMTANPPIKCKTCENKLYWRRRREGFLADHKDGIMKGDAVYYRDPGVVSKHRNTSDEVHIGFATTNEKNNEVDIRFCSSGNILQVKTANDG